MVRGRNKNPVTKPVVFHSVMDGRELDNHAGYAVTTRTARPVDDREAAHPRQLISELYTGIMLVLRLEGRDDRCVMVNASQFTAPLLGMVAKKIGLAGQLTMFQDIRKLGKEVQ